jgi:hypothetical protein
VMKTTPRSEGESALCVSRFVERMLLAGLSGQRPTVVTDGGGGVDEAPKSDRTARTPASFGLFRAGAGLVLSGATAIREMPGCPTVNEY